MTSFKIGDRVVKSSWWKPNKLDQWGRGEGVGVIIKTLPEQHKFKVLWESCTTEEPYPWIMHEEESKVNLTEIPCICCGFIVRHLMDEDTSSPPTSAMWDSGVVFKDGAGYGSSLDGDIYLIAVCDDCLKVKGLKIGEYM